MENWSLFDGMCALVTGSATGLGVATAIALTRSGARVIVNYRASAREADLCRAANAAVKVARAMSRATRIAASWPLRRPNGAGSTS